MTFYKLMLTLCIAIMAVVSFTQVAVAEACTREAMDKINRADKKYINYFVEQNNKQAIDEIRAITPPKSFLTRHQAELEMLVKDKTYQPSQSFCDDIYTIKSDLDKRIKAVAEKYNYIEEGVN